MRPLSAIALTLALLVVALCVPALAESRPSTPVYVIIVNPNNPTTSAERKFLEDCFLKKTTRWPNDEVIRPVDLLPSSPVRRKFTEDVLIRSVEAVKGYWQQRIFSGRDVPPPELDSDEEVVKFVLKYDGGIGYVSGSAPLNGSKVITVR